MDGQTECPINDAALSDPQNQKSPRMRRSIRFCTAVGILAMSSSALPAQTVETRALMHEKLMHSEKVLEVVMTSNYGLLQHESEALAQITKDPAWAGLKTPPYVRYSAAFL
jgi:hypothetical protein